MNNNLLSNLGIDPAYLLIALFVIQIILFLLLINANMKYARLKKSYLSFMKGKDGKTLEQSVYERFEALDALNEKLDDNELKMKYLYNEFQNSYQKTAIVRYDAFHEIGEDVSFAWTILDGNNNGWIFDVMRTDKSTHLFLKEVVKGESYAELTPEERESLEKAVYQEEYDIRDMYETNEELE